MSFRRRYRRVRRRARFQRFHFAVLLTIVVLAYAAVPPVARVVNSMSGGYLPGHYEPKDSEREAWVTRGSGDPFLSQIPWGTVINVLLFLLVAVVWLTVVPTRTARRPPPPH